MTLPQIETLASIAGMLILFISDRMRYDFVAALALSAAVLTGVVPPNKAFAGFASPVIVIIASVLVISQAVTISGVIDNIARRVLRMLGSTTLKVGALTAASCPPSSKMLALSASSCRSRYRQPNGASGLCRDTSCRLRSSAEPSRKLARRPTY